MKNLYLRSMLAAACAVTLAACGGSGGNLYLSGQVSNLAKEGLILLNDGERLPVPAGQSSFVFTKLVKTDDRYDITIAEQPKGAVCSITNGSGKATSYSVSTTVVSCTTNTYPLSGKITGLTSGMVTLTMGPNSLSWLKDSTSFAFDVADGAPYNIYVTKNPDGLLCTFDSSTSLDKRDIVGTMGSSATSTSTLSCKPQ